MGLGRVLDLAFAQKFIGLFGDLEDHLHVQKTCLDLIFLL